METHQQILYLSDSLCFPYWRLMNSFWTCEKRARFIAAWNAFFQLRRNPATVAKWNPKWAFSSTLSQWPLLVTFRCLLIQKVPARLGLCRTPLFFIIFVTSWPPWVFWIEDSYKTKYQAYANTCWFLVSNSCLLFSTNTDTQMYPSRSFTLTLTKTTEK